MTSEWKTEPLKGMVSYIAKGIPPAYVEVEGDNTVRVLNQKCNRDFVISYTESRLHDLSKRSVPKEKYLRDEDILINSTGTGTAGRIAQLNVVHRPTIVDGHMIVLRGNEKVVPRYLGYALKAQQATVLQLDEGSTGQTELNRDRLLSEIEISYPVSLDEQEAIADTLAALDARIAENKAINHHLELMTQAIFMEQCSGGEVAVLSDILTVCYGKDHKRLNDGEIPCYGSGGVMRYVDEAIYSGESVLIPRKGSLNNVLYVNEPFWTVDTMFYTHMTRPNVAKFAYFTVHGLDLAGMNVGSAVPSMTTAVLNTLEIILPNENALASFEETVSPMFLKIQANNSESARLATLRDTLLPKLLSGELSVADLCDAK